MNNLLLVDIPDSGNELGEEFTGIAFPEVSVGENMVEEFTARGVI